MKEKSKCSFTCKDLLLHSIAVLLVFLFVKDTLQSPLLWLGEDSPSYELFDTIDAEETSDDTESEKKEKKEGVEEFIISDRAIIISLLAADKLYASTYFLAFKSRVGERITPPPQQLSC